MSCLAPRLPDGQFHTFRVFSEAGDDIVNNSSPVGMLANVGPGDDTINGGPARESLLGGSGRDILRGNGGADLLTTMATTPRRGALLSDTLDGGGSDDTLRAGRTMGKTAKATAS